MAQTIPNEVILLSTLTLQEAKDSSAVENIVTTQDDLYKADLDLKQSIISASAKEVLNYREAIIHGFNIVREHRMLTTTVVYTPPEPDMINAQMENLESFINDDSLSDQDPLIKMAIIHHQFESIHPFYDGNGRTGRIINILYLVISGLLDLPILYLSRYITHNKGEYYRLIQAIRDAGENNAKQWEDWILFNVSSMKLY